MEENLEIGRRSQVRVQLSHHKASGQKNWGRVKESTAKIEAARAAGLDVQADQYPYTASSTGLVGDDPELGARRRAPRDVRALEGSGGPRPHP